MVDVISIHIPRTAGTSFRHTLRAVYGEEQVLEVYEPEAIRRLASGDPAGVGPGIVALHGHFPATPALIAAFPTARLITWVRDPVDRVASHYSYWLAQPPHGAVWHDRTLAEGYTLLEFAEVTPVGRQVQSLTGRVGAEAFDFVGRVENYAADLSRLSRLLGWPETPEFHVNVASRDPVSAGQRTALKALLVGEYTAHAELLNRIP